MSKLSDLWHGIRSGFDINKMKRDPVGSAAKLAMIYGITSTTAGYFAPKWSARQAEWMRSGFGLYDDPAPRTGQGHFTKGQKLKGWTQSPTAGQGFLERQVRGIGGFAASPWELGNDLRGWYDGKLSWKDVQSNNFGWMKGKDFTDGARELLMGQKQGSPSGRGGGGSGRGTYHKDFRGNVSSPIAANISPAREAGMYKHGGISQALISGAITPENLAMLGYGSGRVTGSQVANVTLDDVQGIKTSLSRSLPTTVAV